MSSCSSEIKDESDVANLPKEKIPKFKKSDYKSVNFERKFSTLIPKYMSVTHSLNGKAQIQYNHLSKEKHVYIIADSKAHYLKSLKARKLKAGKNLLDKFANESLKDMKGMWKVISESKLEVSAVNNMKCLRAQLDVKAFGFPKSKSYFIRFIEGEKQFYTLVCWTTKEQKKSFDKETKVIGLSFKAS